MASTLAEQHLGRIQKWLRLPQGAKLPKAKRCAPVSQAAVHDSSMLEEKYHPQAEGGWSIIPAMVIHSPGQDRGLRE